MSTGKLDQSLDDIVKTNRPRRTVRNRRVVQTTKTTAPAGGVSKNSRPAKGKKAAAAAAEAVAKNQPIIPVSGKGESKIVVNGLPADVTEPQIKEYFGKTIGPVKRAMLTYGPSGQSRGIATIVFNKPGSALEAATNLNGVKVDNRAMKIEVIVDASQRPAKGLGDRIAQPKKQPKKTEVKQAAKSAAKPAAKVASGKGKAQKGRAADRGKPKTAEELDADMTDYFGPGSAVNGAAGQENAAVNGTADAGMEDEIM